MFPGVHNIIRGGGMIRELVAEIIVISRRERARKLFSMAYQYVGKLHIGRGEEGWDSPGESSPRGVLLTDWKILPCYSTIGGR